MSSKAHDFIVAALARKARQMGFAPIALDGRKQDVSAKPVTLPPTVLRHRPDMLGVRVDGSFCIAEAKTASDIHSPRTHEQLHDFALAVADGTGNALLLGVPLSVKPAWERELARVSMPAGTPVETLYIPDALFPDEEV